jgi:hypothetical protein
VPVSAGVVREANTVGLYAAQQEAYQLITLIQCLTLPGPAEVGTKHRWREAQMALPDTSESTIHGQSEGVGGGGTYLVAASPRWLVQSAGSGLGISVNQEWHLQSHQSVLPLSHASCQQILGLEILRSDSLKLHLL